MRGPRFKFPDEVRETTRGIASRMVRDGQIARTPEELEAWIAAAPDVGESLRRGGYGTEFTAHDLFPLHQVFVVKAGGPAPQAEAPPPSSSNPGWKVALAVAVAVLLLALVLGVFR